MKKLTWCSLAAVLMQVSLPLALWAAGGGEVSEIVVVADTRVVHNSFLRYIADTYNTNLVLFAVWSVVLTAVYGCLLGVVMDFFMSKTGLDLKSRKIVEH